MRWNVCNKLGHWLCSCHSLFSPLFGASYRQTPTNTHKHTDAYTPTLSIQWYLNTTPFLCHVDFLLGLTLKSGHHIYSTACIAASMTKPLYSQQRCASVESEQWFEWNHHGWPIQTNASRNNDGISIASLIKIHWVHVGRNEQKLWFYMRFAMFYISGF